MRFAFLLLLPLAAVACAAPSSDEGATSESNLGASYDAMMKQACLDALGPEEPSATAALGDARARELSGVAMLVDSTMDVRYVTCSTTDYSGSRPQCSRMASYERVDTSYSPTYLVEARESYRDVMGRIDVIATRPQLVLESRHVRYPANDRYRFSVEGSFEDLTVRMTPREGAVIPDDLERAGSYSEVTFHGRMGDGKLTLSTTPEPVVQWNVVSCARASLYATY